MSTSRTTLIPAALLACLAGSAAAQPKLVITSLADSFAGSGSQCAGLVYDASIDQYIPYTWSLGVGYTRINGAPGGDTAVFCSEDAGELAMNAPNTTDWGSVNCFAGYCFGSMTGCMPGSPLPPPSPCWTPSIAHRWTPETGWTNLGSLDRMHDAATGRYYGGTRCDGTVNYVDGISGDGRYVIGSAWWAHLTTSAGGPGFGLCGDYYAFRYDSQTGTFDKLPVQSGTTESHALSVSRDGSVISGSDAGLVPDGGGGHYTGRRSCVWVNGAQTIIDPYTNQSAISPVNLAGTVIAGSPGSLFLTNTFHVSGVHLVRWVRQSNGSWTPQDLGKLLDRADEDTIYPLVAIYPSGVSDDGSTIVGTAVYGELGPAGITRAFFWKPTINNGKPIDLGDYLAAADPTNAINQPGFTLSWVTNISADGNSLLVRIWDARNTCNDPSVSLTTGNAGILYLNGANIPCQAPVVGMGPTDSDGSNYLPYGVALNVWASGSWPLSYQWQREAADHPGSWINLAESCENFDMGIDWDYEGVYKNQLRIGQGNCGSNRAGNYRVAVSNSCGTVYSRPARVTFSQSPYFTEQPVDAQSCKHNATMFVVSAYNGGPFTYQWQINDPVDPSGFRDIYDGYEYAADGRLLATSGTGSSVLELSPSLLPGGSAYMVRCVAYSQCAEPLVSQTALYTVCDSDFNCDGFPDFFDFNDFVDAFESGDDSADFNGDGFADFFDFSDYVTAFEVGC